MIAHIDHLSQHRNAPISGDPSPDEIRRRAAAIRNRWTDSERQRRRVTARANWQPPLLSLVDIAANLIPWDSN